MKVKDALQRLGFTISKQNKPNATDAEAFNAIVDFVNNSNKTEVQENLLLAKMYAFVLKEFTRNYNNVDFASKQINKDILDKPLEYHLRILQMELQFCELNNYLKGLNLSPTWGENQNIDGIIANIESNKEKFKQVKINEIKEVWDTWDLDNVIANFEFSFNLALNNFKNV